MFKLNMQIYVEHWLCSLLINFMVWEIRDEMMKLLPIIGSRCLKTFLLSLHLTILYQCGTLGKSDFNGQDMWITKEDPFWYFRVSMRVLVNKQGHRTAMIFFGKYWIEARIISKIYDVHLVESPDSHLGLSIVFLSPKNKFFFHVLFANSVFVVFQTFLFFLAVPKPSFWIKFRIKKELNQISSFYFLPFSTSILAKFCPLMSSNLKEDFSKLDL